jgi:homoserine dehydrogenase
MESQSSSAGIALVGCGTVGSSTASLLIENRVRRTSRSGIDLELKYIVDRNFEHARSAGLPEELYCEDLEKALSDPKVSMVIELVGGTGFAKELILRALNAGKHVITANKALLAHHGAELYRVARERGVSLAFEASCGGGIPIIRALTDGLMANEIDALYGIVNGTCNYILTEMIEQGQSYAEALAEAQASGLAEADPTLDVNGSDSAHKIAIMGSLAFGESADIDKIPVQGIDTLEATDVNFGAEMGYIIKLIASAIKSEEGIFLRVEPAFIPEDHPLAWVSGSFNAVSVYGHSVGHTMYYGRGAGGNPTASAVVADAISIANGSYPRLFSQAAIWPDLTPRARQLPAEQIRRRYYLRFNLQDKPGILSRVTTALAAEGISVSSILQHEAPEEPESGHALNLPVPLVVTTHRVREAAVIRAAEAISGDPEIADEYRIIPILDEHPEFNSM